MKKITLGVLLLYAFLNAQNISELLQKLYNAKELYHKTKVESAGIVRVFSRYDLDRMQVYTLKDLLKSLTFFTYKEAFWGNAILAPSGGDSVLSSAFRLYIDDHEVSSAIYGSSIMQFTDIDMGFVDHAEIYEGGNAISFGNEPGLVTIRLYSKQPKREKGTNLTVLVDNRGTKEAKACITKMFKQNSLLAYLTSRHIERKHIYHSGSDFSRDSDKNSIYLKYDIKDKGYMTLGHFNNDNDAFMGVGLTHTPSRPNDMTYTHNFINLLFDLPYSSMKLNLSIDKMTHKMHFFDKLKTMATPQYTMPIAPYPPIPFSHFDGKYTEDIYKVELKDKIIKDKSQFIYGLQGIQKSYHIKRMLMDGVPFTKVSGPSRLNILSAYAEESYNIDKNNLLIATLKLDNYSDNDKINSKNELISRIGYIHLFSDKLISKIFVAKSYLYPGFVYTSSFFPSPVKNNPSLKPVNSNFIVTDIKYDTQDNNFKVGLSYTGQNNNIVINHNINKFVNNPSSLKSLRYFADFTHHFNQQNKIETEIYSTHFISSITARSPMNGFLIRSLNSIEKFDIFNELVYRSAYTYPLPQMFGSPIRVKKGYDYNLGVRWHINHAFTLDIKGENIFNKASRDPIFKLGTINSLEKRVLVQLEYFF